MDTEGFDDICCFAPCYDIVPVCLFFLFPVSVSVSSCGCEKEARLRPVWVTVNSGSLPVFPMRRTLLR